MRTSWWFLISVAGVALAPSSAHAWGAIEHSSIARSAHALACRTLRETNPLDPTRLAEVCPSRMSTVADTGCQSPPGVEPSVLDQYVGGQDDFAYWISSGAALAGDFLKRPEDFDSLNAQRSFGTIYQYLWLANDNDDHFHPRVVALMLDELGKARALARTAHLQTTQTQRLTILRQARAHTAFALHFAQDAFAAGHMGLNRAGSSAGPSQRLHAVFNKMGRDVVNREGARFHVLGDGNYCAMTNDARFMVVSASAAILLDVFAEYVLDASAATDYLNELEVDPLRYIPVAATMAQALAYMRVGDRPQAAYNHPPDLQSLSTVAGTARQSVSLDGGYLFSRGFSGSPGRHFVGLSGMYMAGMRTEFPIDVGFLGGAYTWLSTSPDMYMPYRVEGGVVARVGFLDAGLVTMQPSVLYAFEGAGATSGEHRRFFSLRLLQFLLEFGHLAYLRAGTSLDITQSWPARIEGFTISINFGTLIGAFGGGPLDLGNVSRGF